MKTINPLFPDQESINTAVNKLSPEARATYEKLLQKYQGEVAKDNPSHDKITHLIFEATTILVNR